MFCLLHEEIKTRCDVIRHSVALLITKWYANTLNGFVKNQQESDHAEWKESFIQPPFPLVARIKAWGLVSLASGIAFSNPVREQRCLSLVCVVFWQVEVSATDESLIQSSLTEYVCVCVIECDQAKL
jgi:hypothetical protein